MQSIIIKGAREHNLKNIDLTLPRDRLIVISGLSGSGKSSLAFDTIFAEGQRRYVESLSAYARQFLGRMEKPDLDYIEGLSPAISIEQKSTNRNPRSTVGTITEIYDYYRLLFARIGIPHDPTSGKPIKKQTIDEIVDAALAHTQGTLLMIAAPIISGRKGEYTKVLKDIVRSGFTRVRIDGAIHSLDETIKLNKKRKHSIDIVVDRLKISPTSRKRCAEAIETALEASGGTVVMVVRKEGKEIETSYSQHYAYPDSDLSFPELEPRLFSFNSPYGACPTCLGLGITMEFDIDLIIPDPTLSFFDDGILPYKPSSARNVALFVALGKHFDFEPFTPLNQLSQKAMNAILYGVTTPIAVHYGGKQNYAPPTYEQFPGILAELKHRYRQTTSKGIERWLEGFMAQHNCPDCDGHRLRPEALGVMIHGKNITALTDLSVSESLDFFRVLHLTETETTISREILKEIVNRLTFMSSVGLDYLTLSRAAATLSGGESQRIRLATQIGSSLVGVLYILDEPTIGLHQRDNQRLLKTLMHLRDIGNTLIIVEHDEQTIRAADHLLELGPGAGEHGGQIVAQGSVADIENNPNSLTGQYLTGAMQMPRTRKRRKGNGFSIRLTGIREHNLKNIDVAFPLCKLILITGVSGSGKSTLLSDVLYPVLANRLQHTSLPQGDFDKIYGIKHVDKVINIDQSPIGRTPRSNPATYVGLFTPIRDLFSMLPEARARGYPPGRFSFNVSGGRCEHCQGAGTIKIEMHFLPDVYVVCDVCHGQRFNRETLDVYYRGKNIYEVLEMSVDEATQFFVNIPPIARRLKTLQAVGLGYIRLGQSALTLSGGEAQRIKLSLELSKQSTGKTFYIMDEPTTGLHMADVQKLMEVIDLLVDKGNTVAIIEHNVDVIMYADYIIDLGPEGGNSGGEIVIAGTPEEVAAYDKSYTGHYIEQHLRSASARE